MSTTSQFSLNKKNDYNNETNEDRFMSPIKLKLEESAWIKELHVVFRVPKEQSFFYRPLLN
jgi:hypothetical protein